MFLLVRVVKLANMPNFGQIRPPTTAFSGSDAGTSIGRLIQLGLSLLIVGAGLYALFNFVIAGYSFLSAGDDTKKISGAWAMIWQTALGLAVAAGAFVIAAIFGKLLFNDFGFLLNPQIPNL